MKLSQVAAGVLATIAMLLFPVVASADSAHGADGGGGGATATGRGDRARPGPEAGEDQAQAQGPHNGKAKVGDRVEAIGTVTPFVGHQRVEIRLGSSGDTLMKKTPYVHQVKGKSFGRFKLKSKPLTEPGKYRVRVSKPATAGQAGGSAKSEKFGLKYIDLDPGDRGAAVKLFNDLLRASTTSTPTATSTARTPSAR